MATIQLSGAAYAGPNTAPTAAQPSLVVALSPNGNQATAANQLALLTATGALTAVQSTPGTPVAGGTVTLNITGSQSAFKIQLAGTFSASSTVGFEHSVDGGTTWWQSGLHQSGGTSGVQVSTVNGGAAVELSGTCAGSTQMRARCLALQGGDSISVTMHASAGIADVSLLSALPPGTNTIGGISLPPNASQEAGGNLAAILAQLMTTLGTQLNDMSLSLRLIQEYQSNPNSQDPLSGRTRVSLDSVTVAIPTVNNVASITQVNTLLGIGNPSQNPANLPADIAATAFATRFRGRII